MSRVGVLGTCLLAGLVWSGCEAKQATEYVGGISTQVTVPRDLKAIRVDVSIGGAITFAQGYRVYDGKVQLPRSLGAFAQSSQAAEEGRPITYTIAGVTNGDLDTDFFANPTIAQVGNSVRVLRRSRQPYIPDEIRFLPMPIKYSCYDVNCGDEETCKGGKCVTATLTLEQAKAKFPLFSPDLVDGTGGTCFSTKACMGLAAAALVVNPDDCTYALVNGKGEPPRVEGVPSPFPALPAGTPWEGLNVEVTYDGGLTKEILDLDDEEGFTYVNRDDPAIGQRFRLAPGLCEMVKGIDDKGNPTKHRITAIRASGTCQPKKLAQPFCAADNLEQMGVDPGGLSANPNPPNDCTPSELEPPRAALLVVVDNTEQHRAFFNANELKAIDLPLRDPAFEQTDIGVAYTPAQNACGTTNPVAVPLEAARAVRTKIIADFTDYAENRKQLVQGNARPAVEGALASAYKTLTDLPSSTYFRRAVVFIGNREFDADQCSALPAPPAAGTGSAVEQATLARDNNPLDPTKPINTFVIQLAKPTPDASLEDPADPGLFRLRDAGKPEGSDYDPDARGTKKNAKDSFQQIINSLATCVYDVNDNASAPNIAEDSISYTDPLLGVTATIGPNATCNGDNKPGAGWGYGGTPPAGKKRIYLCQDACNEYRRVLEQASDFALVYQQPPIAVPIFAHRKACGPK